MNLRTLLSGAAAILIGFSGMAVAGPNSPAGPVACKDGKTASATSSCVLADHTKFGNYTCEKGKIVNLHADGQLKGCYLTQAVVINGISCKDALALRADGKLKRCRSTASATVGDIKDIPAGSWISFYKSGALQRLEVEKAMDMKGRSCKGYMNYFHENGMLKKCQLAEAATIDKVEHKAGAFLCWDDKGKAVADCKMLSWDMLE